MAPRRRLPVRHRRPKTSLRATSAANLPDFSSLNLNFQSADTLPDSPDLFTSLPSEVFDRVCTFLRENDAIEALAALRLTSRRHVGTTNEHLFQTIHLDRRMDSLHRFILLSHSPLSRFVHRVKIDVEAVFPELTWTEWFLNVMSFGKWEFPKCDQWWGREVYEKVLAQERDSLGPRGTLSASVELRQAWSRYQSALASQTRLSTSSLAQTHRALLEGFDKLTNAVVVECSGFLRSKYVVPWNFGSAGDVTLVRRTFKKTLVLPRIGTGKINGRVLLNDKSDRFQWMYSSMVLDAASRTGNKPRHLSLEGIHRDTMTWNPRTWDTRLARLTPRTVSSILTSLSIRSVSGLRRDPVTELELAEVCRMAPSLQALAIMCGTQPGERGFPLHDDVATIESLDEPGILRRLKTLDLTSTMVPQPQFSEFLSHQPPSLKRLRLDRTGLFDGEWIDLFHTMHQNNPKKFQITLFGACPENVSNDVPGGIWLFRSTGDEDSLLSKLLDYINGRSSACPVPALSKEDKAVTWSVDSDDVSVRFMPLTVYAGVRPAGVL
jgi:hypothetical protein